MRLVSAGIVLLFLARDSPSQTFRPPLPDFVQNAGQFTPDVLFFADSETNLGRTELLRNGVRVSHPSSIDDLRMEFDSGSPSVEVRGEVPQSWLLHTFSSTDQVGRRNVAHFEWIRYMGLYPGVDAEWRFYDRGPDTRGTAVRFIVQPGANPGTIRFRFAGRPNIALSLDSVGYLSLNTFGGARLLEPPKAHQLVAGGREQAIQATYSVLANDLAAVSALEFDPNLPLIIEIRPWFLSLFSAPELLATAVDNSGRVVVAGSNYIAGFHPKGEPAFVTRLTGSEPRFLGADSDGNILLAGASGGQFPVGSDAPQPRLDGPGWGLFFARFDSIGALTESTYFGDAQYDYYYASRRLEAASVAPDGGLLVWARDTSPAPGAPTFAGQGVLVKWRPGQHRFAFAARLGLGLRAGADRDGSVVFAASLPSGSEPTTRGVVQPRYGGRPDIYVGKLDPAGGRLLWGTFLSLSPDSIVTAEAHSLLVHPSGTIWIGARLFAASGEEGHVLVALSGDGSRLVFAEGSPVVFARPDQLSLDLSGNLLVVGQTRQMNHPTSVDAPLRGGCIDGGYYRKLSPTGAVLHATYLNGSVAAVDRWGKTYFGSRVQVTSVDPPPGVTSLTCVVNSAGRRRQIPWLDRSDGVVPGQLVTLLGSGLRPDASVRINGIVVRPVAAEPGRLTVLVPESMRGNSAIEVDSATPYSVVEMPSAFDLFTADGHGIGPAAALNEDGSINSPANPARSGSVVSVFGTGAGRESIRAWVDDRPIPLEYAGPAPGLPGVSQVNFRVPEVRAPARAKVAVVAGPFSGIPTARVIIEVAP